MALFGKKGGAKPAKPKKEKKAKKQKQPKQKKGGRRKQKTLIERMGLNETVAAMGLDVLSTVSEEQSAVRELGEDNSQDYMGYTAVAVTEAMLVDAGVTVSDEAFGAFAEALRSEHIKSLLLQNDLDNGILVIIPDESSLEIMADFDFMDELPLQWVVVPFEIEDDSQVVLLDDTTTLAELMDIAVNNRTLAIHNGQMVIDGELPDGEDYDESDDTNVSVDFDDDEDDAPSDDDFDLDDEPMDFDVLDDEPDFDDDVEDVPENNSNNYVPDFDDDDLPDMDDEPELDDLADDDDLFDDSDDFDETSYNDEPIYDDLSDEDELADLSEETAKNEVKRVMERSFYNDELGITVDESLFDLHFDNPDTQILLFDENPTDNSTLSVTLTQMRKDANIELMKQRAMHMQELRSQFNVVMAKSHDQLAEILDYKNERTDIGKKYSQIRLNQERLHDSADDLITKQRQELDAAYNDKRDDVGRHAYNIAVEKYDELHKAQHDAEKARLQDEITIAIDTDADKDVAELYNERRLVASRLFDKATTQALMNLQPIYKKMVESELKLYDQFRVRQDRYLRDNYSNEVLRGQAITEQQRQRAEGDAVRERYEALLAQKAAELEDAHAAANARVEDLNRKHETTLQSTIEEFNNDKKRLEARNESLNKTINELQSNLADVDKRTKSEYQTQLAAKDDIIKGQKEQLVYAEERASKTTKANGGIIAAFVAIALAVGLLGGFVVGHMGSNNNVQAAPANNQPSTIVVTPGGTQQNETPSDNSESEVSSDVAQSDESESEEQSTKESTENSTEASSGTESTQSSDK